MALPIIGSRRRRDDVTTLPGSLSPAQLPQPQQVATPPIEGSGAMPPDTSRRGMLASRLASRMDFLGKRTAAAGDVAAARIYGRAATQNPLVGDLATGGFIGNRDRAFQQQGNMNELTGAQVRLSDNYGDQMMQMIPMQQRLVGAEANRLNADAYETNVQAGLPWADFQLRRQQQDAMLPAQKQAAEGAAMWAGPQAQANVFGTFAEGQSTLNMIPYVQQQNQQLARQNMQLSTQLGQYQRTDAANGGSVNGQPQMGGQWQRNLDGTMTGPDGKKYQRGPNGEPVPVQTTQQAAPQAAAPQPTPQPMTQQLPLPQLNTHGGSAADPLAGKTRHVSQDGSVYYKDSSGRWGKYTPQTGMKFLAPGERPPM